MNSTLQHMLVPFAHVFAKHQKEVLSLRLKKALGRRIQDPPRSFYDKLFWMSCHCDTSRWSQLADKVQVRDYVSAKCGADLLPKLFGVYDTADEIDFDALPDRFVLKTNNGCGTNYIVRSKLHCDRNAIRRGLSKVLVFPYGKLTGQLHYSAIKPKIIAEELMFEESDPEATLSDYKFFCFMGEPKYCYVVSNRVFDERHSHHRMIYDMLGNPHPECFEEGSLLSEPNVPPSLSEMERIAKVLSADFPFVRVDLYVVNGKVKFGEMTFTPGMHSGFTEAFQSLLGENIVLPPAKKEQKRRLGVQDPSKDSIGDGDA